MTTETAVYESVSCTLESTCKLPEKLKPPENWKVCLLPCASRHCLGPHIRPIHVLSEIEVKARFPEILPP